MAYLESLDNVSPWSITPLNLKSCNSFVPDSAVTVAVVFAVARAFISIRFTFEIDWTVASGYVKATLIESVCTPEKLPLGVAIWYSRKSASKAWEVVSREAIL